MSDEGRVDATRERGELCPCRTAPSREAAMVVLSDKVWCDPCIAPLVKALNDGGIPTVASCCGHGEQDGSIVLADGHELVIRTFTPFDGVLYEQESDRSRVFLDRLSQVEEERDALRALAGFALEVLAVGGNGEGWMLGDAVDALRVAVGESDAGPRWTVPVPEDGIARLRSFIGEHPWLAPRPPSGSQPEERTDG